MTLSNESQVSSADELGFIPKEETQALQFLKENPKYDGRGTVIAILDTGVDPGAPGLALTTEGKPKIIDCIDTTGSGNVDISTIKRLPPETREIQGLSGRKLIIPDTWDCSDNEFHVGIKIINQLLPSSLRERCERDWRTKVWNRDMDRLLADAQHSVERHNQSDRDKNSKEYKDELTELNARLETLKEIAKWKYPGMVCDCLVWRDKSCQWKAVVDTSEGKDLGSQKVLGNFRDTLEFGTFSVIDMFNYTVDIYPDENVLIIVCSSGSHATHVASIAAGYDPAEPALTGIAPGAQMISIKIGDSRVGSMETGGALLKAINICIERKVDLINYSYGEPSGNGNCGPIIDAINEAILSHGITFVSSAGNEGPALCTVGSPGGTATHIIGVGALVTPSMMRASYAFHKDVPEEQPFTWSSRGPAFDGWLGPSICAPGGAIASVPNWTLSKVQLKSGTSMSSPNACGCIALMISGLKSENLQMSPFLLKRALVSTARVTAFDPWSVGAGLIQVCKAFEFCRTQQDMFNFDLTFQCDQNRGIFVRSINDTDKQEKSFDVMITPVFSRPFSMPSADDQRARIDFSMPFTLSASVPWIECPCSLMLTNQPRLVMIKANLGSAASLSANSAHYGQVNVVGRDDGVLYGRIPITYIRPQRVSKSQGVLLLQRMTLEPGQLMRNFFQLDFDCCSGTIEIYNEQDEQVNCPAVFTVQTNYHRIDRPFARNTSGRNLRLIPGQSAHVTFNIDSNQIIEVCIGKYWNSMSSGTSTLSARITWSPIVMSTNASVLTLLSCDICTRTCLKLSYDPYKAALSPAFLVGNEIRDRGLDFQLSRQGSEPAEGLGTHSLVAVPGVANNSNVQFAIEWQDWSIPVRPSETRTSLIGRLLGLDMSIFRRLLVYRFTLHSKCDVTIEIPIMKELLYDSPLISQMWMIFDSRKQYFATGDALSGGFVKLPKGDYVVRLQLIHSQMETLDQYKDFAINVVHKLSNSTIPAPDMFRQARHAVISKQKTNKVRLVYGRSEQICIGRIPEDKYPKGLPVGASINGALLVSAQESSVKYKLTSLKYLVVDKARKQNDTAIAAGKNEETPTVDEQFKKSVRDHNTQWIDRLANDELVASIMAEMDTHLPAQRGYLERLCRNSKDVELITKVYQQARKLVNVEQITRDLLSKSGVDAMSKSQADKTKSILLECICLYGRAVTCLKPDNWTSILDDLFNETSYWTDFDDNKVGPWLLDYFVAKDMIGRALSLIFNDKTSINQGTEIEKRLIQRLTESALVSAVHLNLLLTKHPSDYIPF